MIITVLFRCYFSLGGKLFSLRLRYLIVVYLESLLSFFFRFLSKGNVGAMGSRGEPGQPGGVVGLA